MEQRRGPSEWSVLDRYVSAGGETPDAILRLCHKDHQSSVFANIEAEHVETTEASFATALEQ